MLTTGVIKNIDLVLTFIFSLSFFGSTELLNAGICDCWANALSL
jgi:hypothetical protein